MRDHEVYMAVYVHTKWGEYQGVSCVVSSSENMGRHLGVPLLAYTVYAVCTYNCSIYKWEMFCQNKQHCNTYTLICVYMIH